MPRSVKKGPFIDHHLWKKVMSNACYYSALFEQKPQSLKARLGVIRPRGMGEQGVEQLP